MKLERDCLRKDEYGTQGLPVRSGGYAEEEGFYLTTDAGCSCPTPFESHTIEDVTGPLTAEQAIQEATDLVRDSSYFLSKQEEENLIRDITDTINGATRASKED